MRCVCSPNVDGSVTVLLCPVHAPVDPCQTMSNVTGRRRVGTIRRGVCTSCGHGSQHAIEVAETLRQEREIREDARRHDW